VRRVLLLAVVLLLPGAVLARSVDDERFRISVGGFFVDFDATTRVGSDQGPGTEIDLEDDLGMDSDQTELVATARLRLARRHSLGVSAIDYDLGLRAESGGTGLVVAREQEQYPVPLAGLGLVYRFTPRWAIRAGASYFEYSEDEWEGSMLLTDVDVEFHPWRHFGVALGYNFLDIEYDEEGDDPLDVDFDYGGILARIILRF
jgi:hypothetical protein